MAGRTIFAQMLDEKLRALEGIDADRPTSFPRRPRPVPSDPFLFVAPYRSCRASGYPAHARALGPSPRPLTAREQQALEALNRFGAGLAPDFTVAELRSAFRVLARRYHPDGHPASDIAQKAHFARAFGEIVEHHRQLTAVACR
jgi:hypothetical protein